MDYRHDWLIWEGGKEKCAGSVFFIFKKIQKKDSMFYNVQQKSRDYIQL